jgi:hypothetical protein
MGLMANERNAETVAVLEVETGEGGGAVELIRFADGLHAIKCGRKRRDGRPAYWTIPGARARDWAAAIALLCDTHAVERGRRKKSETER